jgi:hypothetical protein
MHDLLLRQWTDLVGRLTGPLTLRIYLQPAMATLYAVRDGLRDAREGRPPYMWTAFTHPEERRWLLAEGWKSIGKVFVLAVILDLVYQVIVFRWFYPFETLVVALVLAVLPYAVLRGLVNRIARLWMRHDIASPSQPTRSRP